MEFNKCSRCGAFYISNSNVCPNCQPKDNCEQLILKNYLAQNSGPVSMETLSNDTGISMKNLNRFLQKDDFKISL